MPSVRNVVVNPARNGQSSTAHHATLRRTCRRLKQASINLGMVRLQLQVGLVRDAEMNLERIHEEIQTMCLRLEGRKKPVLPSYLFGQSHRGADGESDQTLLAECLG